MVKITRKTEESEHLFIAVVEVEPGADSVVVPHGLPGEPIDVTLTPHTLFGAFAVSSVTDRDVVISVTHSDQPQVVTVRAYIPHSLVS